MSLVSVIKEKIELIKADLQEIFLIIVDPPSYIGLCEDIWNQVEGTNKLTKLFGYPIVWDSSLSNGTIVFCCSRKGELLERRYRYQPRRNVK